MKRKMRKFKHKLKKITAYFPIFLLIAILGITYSRYYDSVINSSELKLAPWSIIINDKKIETAGKIDIIVNPIVTERTTSTKTYNDKIVPGCKGYFDVEVNPTGTGVSLDYIIDFNPEGLPGGMVFTKYETLNEKKEVTGTYNTLPSDSKLTGRMSIIDGKLLGAENILRYRIYWDYLDNDQLNTTAPDVDNQSSILIKVTLKQVI